MKEEPIVFEGVNVNSTKPRARVSDAFVCSGRLYGTVVEHPRFQPGVSITSSPIQSIGCKEYETLNTIYKVESWAKDPRIGDV